MSKIDKFVAKAIEIANNSKHGYDQTNRWGPDFDCSSLAYECAHYAGYNVPTSGTRYTGTILNDFTKIGWRADKFDGNLFDLDKGDILLNVINHVAIYIGDGKLVEASGNEFGGITGGKTGDQTGGEIAIRNVYNYPWDYVLTAPSEGGEDSGPYDLAVAIRTCKELLAMLEKMQ